jgi:hypothetical protein
MLPLKSFSSAVTIDFYALCYNRRDANLLYVRPSVRMYQGSFNCRDFHIILYWKIALKYLNLVKIGRKHGTLYIRPKYVLLLAATLNLYKVGLIDRSGISIYK